MVVGLLVVHQNAYARRWEAVRWSGQGTRLPPFVNKHKYHKMYKMEMKNRKIHYVLLSIIVSILITACASNKESTGSRQLIIEEQGSFAVGGIKFSEPGNFSLNNSLKPQGQTFHGDHAYVFYQIIFC